MGRKGREFPLRDLRGFGGCDGAESLIYYFFNLGKRVVTVFCEKMTARMEMCCLSSVALAKEDNIAYPHLKA